MDDIATELKLQSSWMPDGPLKGESDFVEALIRSELVPNSITYIKETYRARRRVYVEDQIRTFFQTQSQVSRVATEIMRGIDDINAVSIQASGLDWSAVFARVRTANLKKSFKYELDQALEKGLDALCLKLITGFPQNLPATTQNLEHSPHKFVAGLHVMLMDREGRKPNDNPAADECEAEDEGPCDEEDFQNVSDRASLRKRFSLLPLRSGKAVFIKLDVKRVKAMCSDALPITPDGLELKSADH